MAQDKPGYEIKVTFKPFKNQYIYLGHYFGKSYPIIDSVMLNEKSEATFKGDKLLNGGIYLIGYPGRAGFFEILVDKNQHFSVIADTATIINELKFVNSPDNVLFHNYQQFMTSKGIAINTLKEKYKTAATKKDSTEVTDKLSKLDKEIADFRADIMKKYPESILTNVLAELDGPELPILDGSSRPFVELIEQAGVKAQTSSRRVLKILKPVEVRQGVKFARLSPGAGFSMNVVIDFTTKAIGRQDISFTMAPGAFARDVAWARTFGFAHQAEQLHAMGKGLGASMDNTVVIEGDAVLNPGGLQAKDEFVRHKLLDVIGHLFLAGGTIEGLYEAEQPGHALNNQLLRAVFADAAAFAWT